MLLTHHERPFLCFISLSLSSLSHSPYLFGPNITLEKRKSVLETIRSHWSGPTGQIKSNSHASLHALPIFNIENLLFFIFFFKNFSVTCARLFLLKENPFHLIYLLYYICPQSPGIRITPHFCWRTQPCDNGRTQKWEK